MFDVAEDAFARAREVPHRTDRDRAQDLRRPREQAVAVFQLVVPRGQADMAAHLQECGDRSSAPRRIAAALLLPPDVGFGTHDHASPVNGEVAREQRSLVCIARVPFGSVHTGDAERDPGDRDPLDSGQPCLAAIVVHRHVPAVGDHSPHVDSRRRGVVDLHARELAGAGIREGERIGGNQVEGLVIAFEADGCVEPA